MDFRILPASGRLWHLSACAAGAICLIAIGCNSETPLPPLIPVKGVVTVDGKKVASGQVSLIPEKPVENVPAPSGKIDSDGNYEVFTRGKPGAPLGKYKVKVTPDMAAPKEGGKMNQPFDAKYSDHIKSKLEFEVIDSAPPGRYDLKLTK